MPQEITNLIKNIYSGSTASIRTGEGKTPPIPVQAGVRQGCPLSPLLFNLAIEPIKAVSQQNQGYPINGQEVSILAYADNLVLISNEEEKLQQLLNLTGHIADNIGLAFKPTKCATFTLDCRNGHSCLATTYTIQGKEMLSLQETEAYRYLGKPTGYHVDANPRETIGKINKELELVHHSLLAPWQKIDAMSTFITPKIDFALRTGVIEKKHLTQTDKLTKRCAKSWMNLPQ